MRAALESLPPKLRDAMSNVEIVVEDENDEDPDLFGLYLGIPLTERGIDGYDGALPDKIAIYRIPLEEEFGDDPASPSAACGPCRGSSSPRPHCRAARP